HLRPGSCRGGRDSFRPGAADARSHGARGGASLEHGGRGRPDCRPRRRADRRDRHPPRIAGTRRPVCPAGPRAGGGGGRMNGLTSTRRLLGFLLPFRRQVLIALLLGCATIVANVGLPTIAAYLISAAALRPLLITLSIPIYLVQALGVGRAFVRYGERLMSHRATLSLLAELRIRLFSCLEPLAPALLIGRRSGDLLSRLVGDLDDLQHIYLRVWAPMVIAAIMCCVSVAIFAVYSLTLALAAAVFLAVAGIAVPLLARRQARGLGAPQVAQRAELRTELVDGIQGMAD